MIDPVHIGLAPSEKFPLSWDLLPFIWLYLCEALPPLSEYRELAGLRENMMHSSWHSLLDNDVQYKLEKLENGI